MRRVFRVLPIPTIDLMGPLRRTRARIENVSRGTGQICPDCGSALYGRVAHGEWLTCRNARCGSTFEVVLDDPPDDTATQMGEHPIADEKAAGARPVSRHRAFARDYLLWLYAVMLMGTVVAIVNRSMLTLAVVGLMPLVMLPAAAMHRYKAWLLENDRQPDRASLAAFVGLSPRNDKRT